MSSLYRRQLEAWLKTLDIKANRVLDIGGGQLPIAPRVNTWDVKEYELLDHDEQYNPDYNEDLNEEITFPKTYDTIFCLEVFEYIYDPVLAHKNLFNALEKGGTAYISYPTIYPLHNPPNIDYLRYSKHAIEKLLEVSGFDSWDITPRVASDGIPYLQNFWSAEQMRPRRDTKDIYDIGYLVIAKK